MIVTITGPAVHRCPYRDELDVGTFRIEYDLDCEPIELHALAEQVRSYTDRKMTHEEFTEDLGEWLGDREATVATVTTEWQTAGLGVRCVTRL